jgi:hypothetical protein
VVINAVRLQVVGWLCGVSGPLLVIAGFFAVDEGGTAPLDAPALVLAREITEQRARITTGAVIGMVGGLLLVGLLASLRTSLEHHGPAGRWLGTAAVGFGTVAVTGTILHGSVRLADAAVADPAVLAESVRPLMTLTTYLSGVLFWGLLGLVTTVSVAGLITAMLPKTLTLAGMVLAATSLALITTDHGGVGLAMLPWLALASAALARTELRNAAAAPRGSRPADRSG